MVGASPGPGSEWAALRSAGGGPVPARDPARSVGEALGRAGAADPQRGRRDAAPPGAVFDCLPTRCGGKAGPSSLA